LAPGVEWGASVHGLGRLVRGWSMERGRNHSDVA